MLGWAILSDSIFLQKLVVCIRAKPIRAQLSNAVSTLTRAPIRDAGADHCGNFDPSCLLDSLSADQWSGTAYFCV